MSPTVVVRGSGSIGVRHARVLGGLGAQVTLWPVRPRSVLGLDPQSGAHVVSDAAGRAALASADLVVVATDTARHVSDTLEALDGGAAKVLLEKPAAPSAATAERLAAHARAGDVWVAAPLRAYAAFRHIRSTLPTLGGDLSAHVWSQSWLPDWRPGRDYRESYSARLDEGGVLRDLVHELDYLAVLFGQPSTIGARLAHRGPLQMPAEQAATLLLSTTLAPAVTVRLDYITRPVTRGLLVRGPNGSIEWDFVACRVLHTDASGSVTVDEFPADRDRDATMAVQAQAALQRSPADDPEQLRAAGAPATLADGLATLRLCDEVRARSSEHGYTTGGTERPTDPDSGRAHGVADTERNEHG